MTRIWFGYIDLRERYIDLCERVEAWAKAYYARYNGYQGTHRKGTPPGRFVGWREKQRARVAAWLTVHTQPVVEEPKDWAYPELHADAHEITVPMTPPMYSAYYQLKPRVMDAQARMDRRSVRLRTVAYGDPIDDEWEPEPALVGAR